MSQTILLDTKLKKISKRCLILKELFLYESQATQEAIQEKSNTIYIKYLLDNNMIPSIFAYPMAIIEYENKIEIWTEYMPGKSLANLLINNLIILPALNDILIKIANGIKYLEANQAQHMDLHTNNIIVNDDYSIVKIIDYGSMIIPGRVLTLGSNASLINIIPRESTGYAMYTLLFNALEEITGREPCSYCYYFKMILDDNGLAFTGDPNGIVSAFSLSHNDNELQEEELRRLKKYSGAAIEQYLIDVKRVNNW